MEFDFAIARTCIVHAPIEIAMVEAAMVIEVGLPSQARSACFSLETTRRTRRVSSEAPRLAYYHVGEKAGNSREKPFLEFAANRPLVLGFLSSVFKRE
ncbi:hypothetical protein ACIPRI_08995 [Variovorax sp. LARHSF232]